MAGTFEGFGSPGRGDESPSLPAVSFVGALGDLLASRGPRGLATSRAAPTDLVTRRSAPTNRKDQPS